MALLSAWLSSLALPLSAADNSLSMSIEDFRKLSAADQQAVVLIAFEQRLKLARNVYYESTTRASVHEDHNQHIGKAVVELNPDGFRHWRLGDSYRMDITRYAAPDATDYLQLLSTGFDATAGIVRGTVRVPNLGGVYARIDTIHDPPTSDNRYAYWLDGEHNPASEYIIRYLVDHQTTYTFVIPEDGDEIQLMLPWTRPHRDKPWGTRQFTLDPRKGFLPVRGEGRWDDPAPRGGKPFWRFEAFTVNESQLAGDVWRGCP